MAGEPSFRKVRVPACAGMMVEVTIIVVEVAGATVACAGMMVEVAGMTAES